MNRNRILKTEYACKHGQKHPLKIREVATKKVATETRKVATEDVAEALGYEAPKNAILSHIDDEERILVNAETQHRFSAEFSYKESAKAVREHVDTDDKGVSKNTCYYRLH